MASWADLFNGKSRATIFAQILAGLKGIGFRIDDWEPGAVVRTILDVGFSAAFSINWDAIASVTKGGFLRLAQGLAEDDIVSWNTSPQDHWLYLLATQLFFTTPKLSEFTVGTVRFRNTSTNAQTLTPSHVVKTTGGLRYAPLAASTALPAGGSVWISCKADEPGGAYNVGEGAINTLTVSLPGVDVRNEPDPAVPTQTSWITTYGSDTETPKELADRCAERWGRLSKLQALPADAYKSLAKESHSQVRKVAVWPNFSDARGVMWPNAVTLYLGGESGPVAAAVATLVLFAMAPYVGIHDTLECVPCGTATMTITGTIFVRDGGLIATTKAAVEAALVADQATLDIGQTVHAWRIRKVVAVSGVENFTETLADFVPAKNALVAYNYAGIVYAVGT